MTHVRNSSERVNRKTVVEEEEFQEAVAEMIEDQASAIMEVLKEEPWSGKILSVDGKSPAAPAAGRTRCPDPARYCGAFLVALAEEL